MIKVHVVAHTHWDREWYFTEDDSLILATDNLKHVIETLKKNPEFKSFHFDGQTKIIEEYLNLCSTDEKKDLLELIKNKRLFVGPWYTQSDLFLANQESIVRNLEIGMNLAKEFGYLMNVGYVPDSFGHNSSMPEILENFEINNYIFWRGIPKNILDQTIVFDWKKNNSKINAYNMFYGYGAGKMLTADQKIYLSKYKIMLDKIAKKSPGRDILLPVGGDQVLINNELPKIIKTLNSFDDQYEFIFSSYEEFSKTLGKNAVILESEMRAPTVSRIHKTINSQRMDIKKIIAELENKLLNHLEPLIVLCKWNDIYVNSQIVNKIWKELLACQAHDSLGGCNSDQTNEDIKTRIKKALYKVDSLITLLKRKIAFAISQTENDGKIYLYNLSAVDRSFHFSQKIYSNYEHIKLKWKNKKLDFSLIETKKIDGGLKVVTTQNGDVEIKNDDYFEHFVSLNLKSLKAFSIGEILIEEEKKSKKYSFNHPNFIENKYYKLGVKNQELVLFSKQSNEIIEQFLTFEQCENAGDSYDFSPKQENNLNPIFAKMINVSFKNYETFEQCNATFELKKTEHKMNLEVEIKLFEDDSDLDIRVLFKNEFDNSRIRLIVKTNVQAQSSFSWTPFAISEYENHNEFSENWRSLDFKEKPVPIESTQGYIALKSNQKKAMIFSHEIREYEILNNQNFALTLVKSIGILGKDNIAWRPGRASGINNVIVETPLAQNKICFDYKLKINFSMNNQGASEFIYRNQDSILVFQNQQLALHDEILHRFSMVKPQTHFKNGSIKLLNKKFLITSCYWKNDQFIIRGFNSDTNEISAKNLFDKKYQAINFLYKKKNLGNLNPMEIATFVIRK